MSRKDQRKDQEDGQSGNGADSGADRAEASAGTGKSRRPKSIDEALRVLDEALSGPAADLKAMVTDEVEDLNSAIRSTIGAVGSAIQDPDGLGGLAETLTAKVTETKERLTRVAEELTEQGREACKKADAEIRANPWPFVGGLALGSFALGVIFGSANRASARTESPSDATDDSHLAH